jgi:leucyl/phenylalanyl-tRNA---protein transferase
MRPQRTVTWLTPNDGADWFPPIEQALDEPDGLLAAGGDLSTRRILAAYRRGIFPWYSPGQPILWWSPDPREVLWPNEFKLHRSLAKTIRNRGFTTTFDKAFEAVVEACAAPRERHLGTWITNEMQSAYTQLHREGAAHSVEVWDAGRLVGGLYGVLLGRVFFGESMFSRERDASKTALAALVSRGLATDLELIDCQMATPHLRTLGSRPFARAQFIASLAKLTAAPPATTFASAPPPPA